MSIILKDYTKYFNKYYHKVLYIHSLQMIKTSFSKLRVPRDYIIVILAFVKDFMLLFTR